ncbi:unnamed protein product [Sphagnum tenellum]
MAAATHITLGLDLCKKITEQYKLLSLAENKSNGLLISGQQSLRQHGDLKETASGILYDLQWYRSILCSILLKHAGQDNQALMPEDSNGMLSVMDRYALTIAAKRDEKNLKALLGDLEENHTCSGECWDGKQKDLQSESDSHVGSGGFGKASKVGSGAFGRVSRVVWHGETYAMKRPKQGYINVIKQEIKALVGLNHPHVMRVLCCTEVPDKECSYIMELMDMSLEMLLKRHHSSAILQAVDLMLQVA